MSASSRKRLIIGLVVVLVVIVAGVIAYQFLSGPGPATAPGPVEEPVVVDLLPIGTKAPDFTFTSAQAIEGSKVTHSLSDYEGNKAVILVFPAPGPGDMKQAKAMNDLVKENRDNLEIIIAAKNLPPMAAGFLAAQGIIYPVVNDATREIHSLYGAGPKAVIYYIGKDGVIANVTAPGVGDPDSSEEFEANVLALIPIAAPAETAPEEVASEEIPLPVPEEEVPLVSEEIELE